MTNRLLVPVPVVVVALVLTAVASAETLCAAGAGTYPNGAERGVPLTQTYKSKWDSNTGGSYIARRYDASGRVTFQRSVPSGPTTFTNPVDALRRSTMQNTSGSMQNWAIQQYALGSC